jgi:hypothetical protein
VDGTAYTQFPCDMHVSNTLGVILTGDNRRWFKSRWVVGMEERLMSKLRRRMDVQSHSLRPVTMLITHHLVHGEVEYDAAEPAHL